MDENSFVQYLEDNFRFSHGNGIGDDTSVVRINNQYQLITKDILIEDIHFKLTHFSIEEIALKSLSVNISDIAAMGGVPEYFYLGLGFPDKFEENSLKNFFKELKKGCKKWNLELAGGDFSKSPKLFISITLVGKSENPVYRNNAKNKDFIGITGITGESAIGLKLIEKGENKGYFIEKHKKVDPEIKNGLILAKHVNSMIDVSDGLLIDLNRILIPSKKGAKIFYEKIPVSQRIREICRTYKLDEHEMVLTGGEDYILLFTISPGNEPELSKENIKYHIIGEINNTNNLVVERDGKLVQVKKFGYDHFKT